MDFVMLTRHTATMNRIKEGHYKPDLIDPNMELEQLIDKVKEVLEYWTPDRMSLYMGYEYNAIIATCKDDIMKQIEWIVRANTYDTDYLKDALIVRSAFKEMVGIKISIIQAEFIWSYISDKQMAIWLAVDSNMISLWITILDYFIFRTKMED